MEIFEANSTHHFGNEIVVFCGDEVETVFCAELELELFLLIEIIGGNIVHGTPKYNYILVSSNIKVTPILPFFWVLL